MPKDDRAVATTIRSVVAKLRGKPPAESAMATLVEVKAIAVKSGLGIRHGKCVDRIEEGAIGDRRGFPRGMAIRLKPAFHGIGRRWQRRQDKHARAARPVCPGQCRQLIAIVRQRHRPAPAEPGAGSRIVGPI